MSEVLPTGPNTNTFLFGHSAAEESLLTDVRAGKLPHGLIITGAKGVGKATLAYRLARMLLSGQNTMEMAADHNVLRRIAAGSHSDMLVIEPEFDEKKGEFAREISVEQAREVGQFLSMTAGESNWRVVIIDAIDAMNPNAANAILKVLEEPPPQALLILISHNPGRLLPTIRSRCRTLKLRPLSTPDFTRALGHLLPDASAQTIDALYQLCGPSPGMAAEYEALGALQMYGQLLDILGNLPTLDNVKLHAFAEQIGSGDRHANWQLVTRLLLVLFSRVARTAAGIPVDAVDDDEPRALAHLSLLHSPAVWAAKWQQCLDQFSMAERLHLDYKQIIIAFIHSIASREGFLLGNIAA